MPRRSTSNSGTTKQPEGNLCGVGDASDSGFGVSSWKTGDKKINALYWTWKKEVTNHKSSNIQEAANLVINLRDKINKGEIDRSSEVFVFTDNLNDGGYHV